jgi:C1A family cysteine protease
MADIKVNNKVFQLNTVKSPEDLRDFIAENLLPDTNISLPDTYDLRPQLVAVKDQGQTGTCSAQTASCMKEWQERKESGFTDAMSAFFIYNNKDSLKTPGISPRETMRILLKVGSVPESVYSKKVVEEKSKIPASVYDVAKKYVIKNYSRVFNVDGLKKAIYLNGPSYISFPVYNSSSKQWIKNGSETLRGYHAMCAVGWTSNSFIIRNSWGNDWADGGYTYFPFSEWGKHSECWTATDEKSNQSAKYYSKPQQIKRNVQAFFQRVGWVFSGKYR